MKKYLICPGYVISKNDGDRHYISAHQLMRLYKVKPSECVISNDPDVPTSLLANLLPLRPRYDGDYCIDMN